MQENFQGAVKNRYEILNVNRSAAENPRRLVLNSEKYYHDRVNELAGLVLGSGCRAVFIAGPSASGKTTTAKKLLEEIKSKGKNAVSVSLDDFLKDADALPILSDGTADYESVNTLDIPCFQRFISDLMKYKKALTPRFDFLKRGRACMVEISIENDCVVIIEGLHALNPLIADCDYEGRGLKAYISVKSEYYENGERVLNSRDMRLIRRLIRDNNFRGSDAENTFRMWKKVCEGEREYIQPFKDSSDFWLDSDHIYEPLIYNYHLTPVLKKVSKTSEFYADAQRLLGILSRFSELDKAIVPADSMLREFIGEQTS